MIPVYGIFGIPGAGKTTHGRLLKDNNPELFIHISTGDIFRNIRKKKLDMDLIAKMDEWDKTRSLYPDELTAKELDKYVNQLINEQAYNPEKNIIILDGYPRNLKQISMMEEKYDMKKLAFIYIPQSLGLDRIVNHRNKKEARPEDANIIELANSIDEHEHNIFQIMDHYTRMIPGPAIRYIIGDQTKEKVYTSIETFFKT